MVHKITHIVRTGPFAGVLHRSFADFSNGEAAHGLISSCHTRNGNSKAWEVLWMNVRYLILLGGMDKKTLKQVMVFKTIYFITFLYYLGSIFDQII